MNEIIIYPIDDTIAVLTPVDPSLTIGQIAQKDVPQGVPYKIISADAVPQDRTFRMAWEADFSEPDGFGDPAGYWAGQEGEE